jgi:hypothetical protein
MTIILDCDCLKDVPDNERDDWVFVSAEWLTEHTQPAHASPIQKYAASVTTLVWCVKYQVLHMKLDEDDCYILPTGDCISPSCSVHR